jgi:hypothetical protein
VLTKPYPAHPRWVFRYGIMKKEVAAVKKKNATFDRVFREKLPLASSLLTCSILQVDFP